MLTKQQVSTMTDIVAQAIFGAIAGDETWLEADEDLRNQCRLAAVAAMGAHDAFLGATGYAIVEVKLLRATGALAVPSKKILGIDGKPVN